MSTQPIYTYGDWWGGQSCQVRAPIKNTGGREVIASENLGTAIREAQRQLPGEPAVLGPEEERSPTLSVRWIHGQEGRFVDANYLRFAEGRVEVDHWELVTLNEAVCLAGIDATTGELVALIGSRD